MPKLHDELNRLFRYSADEKAEFEKAIDANPLDHVTKLVYADWLDENGEPKEATFQRAMGEWVNRPEPPFTHHPGYRYSHRIAIEDLPEWEHGEISRNAWPDPDPVMPHTPQSTGGGIYGWRSYRAMEEALRRAHREATKYSQPE